MSRKMLIIGATSSIAQATAKIFALENTEFFLVARNLEKLQSVAQDLKVRGATKCEIFSADLNDFAQHQIIVDKAYQALGGLDTVLIAHGTLSGQKVCQADYKNFENEFKTNFLSVCSLLIPLANKFEEQKHGDIAVISSVAGDRGRQSNYAYGSAKAALNSYLSGLRNRLSAANVNVLTIKPGFVDTPMTAEFKKSPIWAKPESIAQGIHKAINQKKSVVYLPWFWQWIMLIIKHIPEVIFKRMKL